MNQVVEKAHLFIVREFPNIVRDVSIEIVKKGHYTSNVLVMRICNGEDKVMKIIANSHEVSQVLDEILDYHAYLRNAGVSVPNSIGFYKFEPGGDLVEVAQFCGESLDDILSKADDDSCRQIVYMICRDVMNPLFQTSSGLILDIGLDPIPRNMTLFFNGSNFIVVYIDFIPPKINGILEIPEPEDSQTREMGFLRHYDKRGLTLNLLMQLSRLRPDKRDLFKEVIFQEMKHSGEYEVIRFLEETPSINFKFDDKGRIQHQIEKLTGFGLDYYILRDVACEICAKTGSDCSKLEKVFMHTHFSSCPPSHDNIKKAKFEIISMLETTTLNNQRQMSLVM